MSVDVSPVNYSDSDSWDYFTQSWVLVGESLLYVSQVNTFGSDEHLALETVKGTAM